MLWRLPRNSPPGRCNMERYALGVVGGLGPEGVARFLDLVERMGHRPWPGRRPEVIIRNFPAIPDGSGYLLGCNLRSPLPGLTRVSRELAGQNVRCIAIPCITANYFYRELCDAVDRPIVNPVEETAKALQERGVSCAGILATEATVQADLFGEAFRRRGIRVVYPGSGAAGNPLEEHRRELENKGAEITVLGCAHLSAAMKDRKLGPEYLDVMQVFAAAALRQCGITLRSGYPIG